VPIELTRRDRRALGLGMLVLALGLVRFVLVPSAAQLAELRAAVAAERDLLARERDLLASVGTRADAGDALVEALATYGHRMYPPGAAPDIHLRRLAEASNVSVISIQRLPSPDSVATDTGARAHTPMTRLRLQGESDLEGALSLLGALATADRLLVVEELELSHQQPVVSTDPEILQIGLIVRVLSSSAGPSEGSVP